MVDDNPEDATPSPDSGRARRTPPTIDLEPAEVSGETRSAGEDVQPEGTQPEPASREPAPRDFALGHRGHVRRGRRLAGDLCGLDVGVARGFAGHVFRPAAQRRDGRRSCRARRRHRGQDQQACKPRCQIPQWPIASKHWRNPLPSLRGDLTGLRAQSEETVRGSQRREISPARIGALGGSVRDQ